MVVIATNADHKDDETSKVNNVCLEGQAGETCVLDIALDNNNNSSSTSSTSSTYVQLATGTCENVGLKTIQTSSGCQAASNALGLDSSIRTKTNSGFTSGCYNGGSSSGVRLNHKAGNNCGTCSDDVLGQSSCSYVTTFCICEKGGSSSPVVRNSSGSTNVTVPSNSNASLCLAGNGGILCAVCDPNHARYGSTKPCEQCSSLVGKAYV